MSAEKKRSLTRRPDGRLDLWVCSRCGYVYDGSKGEPLSRTPPDTGTDVIGYMVDEVHDADPRLTVTGDDALKV